MPQRNPSNQPQGIPEPKNSPTAWTPFKAAPANPVEEECHRSGRRRSQDARALILEAARQMAKECTSYKTFTMEGIAKTAKVSKATIYRWWSSKLSLLAEACFIRNYDLPNSGDLAGDLESLIRQEIRVQGSMASRPVFAGAWAEMVELVSNAECPTDTFVCQTGDRKRASILAIFEQARERGEWTGPVAPELVYAAMYSTVFFWCVGKGVRFDDARIQRLAQRMVMEAKPLAA